jgi:SRSO17 transposase
MKIPCIERLPFLVSGLTFLAPAFTRMQFDNLTLIATALVLGAKFSLTEVNRMWLKEKAISTLSYFLSDAKFSTKQMQELYALHVLSRYNIKDGYFIIDDTMMHRSNFCKWIHGVFILFDHVLKTNLKAICIVVLYYSDGGSAKAPLAFRIYYQEDSKMPWAKKQQLVCVKKYDLAAQMLEWVLEKGYPECIVLADSWYCCEPFIEHLKRLKLNYVFEMPGDLNIRITCSETKLTPTGRVAKNQYDLKKVDGYFASIQEIICCGFAADKDTGKKAKVLYHTKITTGRLNAIPGKHRIVQSFEPVAKTTKYFLTNKLDWEASKIITVYSHRWVIEEFFRNAKQLLDMEGATVRSEQGVTVTLCLVFCVDFLLHLENCKSTVDGLSKESQTIPSIIRRFQYDNLNAFLNKILTDNNFVIKWLNVEKQFIHRKRKEHKTLESINQEPDLNMALAA